jgi:hypothetical protein
MKRKPCIIGPLLILAGDAYMNQRVLNFGIAKGF